jgi:hypothetical protein
MPENPFLLFYAMHHPSTIAGYQSEFAELLDGFAALRRDTKDIEADL